MSFLPGWLDRMIGRARIDRRSYMVELYLAIQALVFGLWLLAPWPSFRSIPRVYDTLGLIPESVWGLAFSVEGLVHLWALGTRNMAARRGLTRILTWLWLMVLFGVLATVPTSTATPMYLVPALAALWASGVHTRRERFSRHAWEAR